MQASLTSRIVSPAVLTLREKEIVQLMTTGAGIKGCANQLNISTKTVEFHWENVRNKLKIYDTVQITHWALQTKLIEPLFQHSEGIVPELKIRKNKSIFRAKKEIVRRGAHRKYLEKVYVMDHKLAGHRATPIYGLDF